MNFVDEKQTRKVAELARLELSDAEVRVFAPQLDAVLAYVEQISSVDTAGVTPLVFPHDSGPRMATPLRDDEIRPSPVDKDGNPKALSAAPESFRGGFKVPPVL